ncbi:MAG TPA: hypothetical protein VMY78_08230 [Solirubrobacteraceae bacterium]|nr:hypothetical protein [Solirubrobacteraceae bacterium]
MELPRLVSLTHPLRVSHEQLSALAPYAAEQLIPAGRRRLLDDPLLQELVIVATGRGLVRCAGEVVRELGPGDIFGSLAVERPVYVTTALSAVTDLQLIVFSARSIRLLRDAAPEAVAGLLAACATAPPERAGLQPEPRPASHLSLVRSAA